jgi:hypothetical protein
MLYPFFIFKCDMTFKITIESKFNSDSFEPATTIFFKKKIIFFLVLYIYIFSLLFFFYKKKWHVSSFYWC